MAVANAAIYLYGREYGARQHIIETGLADRLAGFVNTAVVEARGYPLFAALFVTGWCGPPPACGRHRGPDASSCAAATCG